VAQFEKYSSSIPIWPTSVSHAAARAARRLGQRTARRSRQTKGVATRDASSQALNAVGRNVPWLIGGSADLAPSCKTRSDVRRPAISGRKPLGRNLHFGIREHAMAAVLNGLSLSKIGRTDRAS
jgi:transketolase